MGLREMIAKVGLDASGFEAGTKRVEHAGEKMAHHLQHTVGDKLAEIFGLAALEEGIRRTIEFGAHMEDTARRLNIGTEALQEFEFAAKHNGSSLETMTTALEKMGMAREKALGNSKESDKFRKQFAALGVGEEELKTARAEDIIKIIGDAVKNGDPQALIGPLRSLLGRSAGELVPAFKAGLDEMAREARASGSIMSKEIVAELKQAEPHFILGPLGIAYPSGGSFAAISPGIF